jgi:hypothetical protein
MGREINIIIRFNNKKGAEFTQPLLQRDKKS